MKSWTLVLGERVGCLKLDTVLAGSFSQRLRGNVWNSSRISGEMSSQVRSKAHNITTKRRLGRW